MTGNCCVHRKVVRRASLSDRHNLCRKEYETEAIVWRGGRGEEPEKEKETDQENNQIVQVRIRSFRFDSVSTIALQEMQDDFLSTEFLQQTVTISTIKRLTNDAVLFIKGLYQNICNPKPFIVVLQVKPVMPIEQPEKPRLQTILKDGISAQNGLISTKTSTPAPPPSNGTVPTSDRGSLPTQEESWPKERAQTLSELKKQRAAAKLLNHPLFNGHLGNGSTDSFSDAKSNSEDPRMPLVSSNGSAVYYTPASGDPPLLKLKQPAEDEQPKAQTCCCVS